MHRKAIIKAGMDDFDFLMKKLYTFFEIHARIKKRNSYEFEKTGSSAWMVSSLRGESAAVFRTMFPGANFQGTKFQGTNFQGTEFQ
jgi:uncharacterized protein YjbI with pentapeptide repeats